MSGLNWEKAKRTFRGKAPGVDSGKAADKTAAGFRSPTIKQLRYLEYLTKRLGFKSAGAFLLSIGSASVTTCSGARLAIREALRRLEESSMSQ